MRLSTDELKEMALRVRRIADDIYRLGQDLEDASKDIISIGDIDMSGAYSAASFVREDVPILERL